MFYSEETRYRELHLFNEVMDKDRTNEEHFDDSQYTKFVELLDDVSMDVFFELITTCNYLGLTTILMMLVKRTADMMRSKNVDEIREIFSIVKETAHDAESDRESGDNDNLNCLL